jgi:hypothetical protein
MIILILWIASASVGLTIGAMSFRALVIVLGSPVVAFLSVAVLLNHGLGLVDVGLISVGSLAALQSFYLLGASIRYLTMPDEYLTMLDGRPRPEIEFRAQDSDRRRKSAERSSQPQSY